MTTHSSILAWRIPWTEELDGLPSLGSQRVGHDWSDLARTMRKVYQVNINPKKVVVARLIAHKIDFKRKGIFRDRYYIMVK